LLTGLNSARPVPEGSRSDPVVSGMSVAVLRGKRDTSRRMIGARPHCTCGCWCGQPADARQFESGARKNKGRGSAFGHVRRELPPAAGPTPTATQVNVVLAARLDAILCGRSPGGDIPDHTRVRAGESSSRKGRNRLSDATQTRWTAAMISLVLTRPPG